MNPENDELLEKEIDKLIEIYEMLISQPTPEEEEDAQKDLLNILKDIKEKLGGFDQFHELDELYQIISDWDTLEAWFYEVNGLEEKLVNFLSKFRHVKKREKGSNASIPIPIPQNEQNLPDSANVNKNEMKIDKTLQTVEEKMKNLMSRDHLIKKDHQGEIKSQAHIETLPQKNPLSSDKPHLKSKLVAPKIVIPPVMAPKKKIDPKTISNLNINKQSQAKTPIKIDYVPPESSTQSPSPSPPTPKSTTKSEFRPKINPISNSRKTIKIHPITADQFKISTNPSSVRIDNIESLSSKELYKELIGLEAMHYHLLKKQKILEEKHNFGQIDDSKYATSREEINLEVKNCMYKIQKIKSFINR